VGLENLIKKLAIMMQCLTNTGGIGKKDIIFSDRAKPVQLVFFLGLQDL
jgi:hypothetical protein